MKKIIYTAVLAVISATTISRAQDINHLVLQNFRDEPREEIGKPEDRPLDSLVRNARFEFVPQTMQQGPGGALQNIPGIRFYVTVTPSFVSFQIPYIASSFSGEKFRPLNRTTYYKTNYRAVPGEDAWTVNFSVTGGGSTDFSLRFTIPYSGGSVRLELMEDTGNTVIYNGFIRSVAE